MKYSLNNLKVYILAVFAAIVIVLILLYPALPKLNSLFIGDSGDNYEYASYMMLFSKNLSAGHFPFEFTNFWRYPVGFNFAISFDSHLAVVLGGTLSYFISSALYYNLTVIALMALNGIFSFVFFYYLTRSKVLGILGMITYGFCFYTLGRAEAHLNLLFIGGFPLLGYAVLRIFKEPKINLPTAFWFFFSLLLLALGSKEYLLLAVFFLLIYLIITTIFYKSAVGLMLKKIRESYKLILANAVFFLILFLVVFWPYVTALTQGQLYMAGRGDTLFVSTPSIIDFIIPNRYLTLLSSFVKSNTRYSIESIVFVGWVELLVFIFFFLSKKIRTKFKFFILTLFLVPFLLALGYGQQDLFPLLPYHFLKGIFIFDVFAETNRYFIIFYLVMIAAAALTLAPFRANKRTFTAILITVITIALLERVPLKIMVVPTLNDNYTKIVQKLPGSAVLDLPVNMYYANYDLLSFYYQKPVVNGYFHWISDGPKQKAFINSSLLYDYSCNGLDDAKRNDDSFMLENLNKYNIKTVVVHKDHTFYFTDCKNVRIRLNRLFSDTLVVPETTQQQQLVSKVFTGYPKLTLYFPKKGTFNLDGLYVAPDSQTNFNIVVSNSLINNYVWHNIGSVYAMEMLPRNQIVINVNAGSTITIYSNDLIENTYFAVWYRYAPDKGAQPILYQSPFEKVYENDKVIIYQLQ